MAKSKKFGTFGGVFTPSVLTILGVIMYMRLPWIIGQSGLFITIGIVLIAHIVSVTTGLSVSSIATDKKVKAGGTYYIISRSLGLPIGGTLGIALFFGLSLSVSLYLIGFSESFLGFWEIPITKDTIRITGTIALVAVATLTFISTSLAIKTQYFIMAAIFLSLITIIFGNTDFKPVEPLLHPVENAVPFIVLFAIFFPAVTGFEAGVSMSGDLEDPKKSIPVGTISAIVVGLLVYIGLSIFFAYNVNSDQLINNPNILLEMSFLPQILVAGIWGATISSTIGSILGAPRILQATSADRITPKIFAKGFGPTNEPRNALMLTFLIAEAGILVGELNLIARIVSMFFITTYGFLNLSSTIEKLTSTDYRPSFNIPTWVSIVGAIVCFYLMLELDFVALIGATIIMGGIFVFLKNRELTLESGDTWEGVWSSVLRSGLNKLNSAVRHQRNWRPNIILFSGGQSARPHLIELGRWLVKKRGILSNFNLIENKDSSHLIKIKEIDKNVKQNEFDGIFARQMEVNNVYEGMETITKVYGFAGIEPNSVMFGWARDSKDRASFNRLMRIYQKLDQNIFILDYDKEKGFGNKKRIDLWWRGSNNNATLALTLIKFLQMEDEWNDVEARIFIITNDSSIHNRIYKNVSQILDDQRISASIKIINNSIENKSFVDIIKLESIDTDLVILGLPEIKKDDDIIQNTDKIIGHLNTVLLIHASSFFKPLYIGIENTFAIENKPEEQVTDSITNSISLPQNDILYDAVKNISTNVEQAFNSFHKDYISKIIFSNKKNIEKYISLTDKLFKEFDTSILLDQKQKGIKLASKVISNYYFNSRGIIDDYRTKIIAEQKEFLALGIQSLQSQLGLIKENLPEELVYVKEHDISKPIKENQLIKKLKSIGILDSEKKVKINIKEYFNYNLMYFDGVLIYPFINEFTFSGYQLITQWQKLNSSISNSLQKLERLFEKGDVELDEIEIEKNKLEQRFQSLIDDYKNNNQKILTKQWVDLKNSIQNISDELQNEQIRNIVSYKKKVIKKLNLSNINLLEIPAKWEGNQNLLLNFFIQDIYLISFQNRIEKILERNLMEISIFTENNYINPLEEIIKSLDSIIQENNREFNYRQAPETPLKYEEFIKSLILDFNAAINSIPETIEIMSEDSFQNLEINQYGEITSVQINLRRYLNFLVETDLLDPLQNKLIELSSQFDKTKDTTYDVIRFTNYNLSQNNDSIDESQDSHKQIFKQSIDRLKNELTNIKFVKNQLIENYDKYLTTTFEKLNPYLISRSVGEFKHSIRTKEGQEIVQTIKEYSIKTKNFINNSLVRLVYKQSEGVLFAKKIGDQTSSFQTETGKVLNVVNQMTPDTNVLNKLPFYYKQLFLGKHYRSNEFLIPRENELNKAAGAIENYRKGFRGGLLILGDPQSGKSTLSNTIANKNFESKKIYQLNPPESGSISLKEFEQELSFTFKHEANPESIFESLSSGSVLIIHDLELWWERSQNGYSIIDRIVSLIENYSSNCFFIVNSGAKAFQFINRLQPIENIFISAISCQPFDAEDLKEAILLRHRSSGFSFILGNQEEEQISNLRLANLFNNYFDISGGNIGLAILSWISNIEKVKSNQIVIKKPETAQDYFLDKLNMDWFLLLQQFVLHKQLSLKRLSRILGLEIDKVSQQVEYLKRSGLLVEYQSDIFHINPYLHNLISKKLIELDLI